MITDRDKQMGRWFEHYLELYSNETCVSAASIKTLPQMDELDTQPTLVELSKAIDVLSNDKAPGEDGIPPEIIKRGKEVLPSPLNDLLPLCWNEGFIPQDMRNAKIVTLYKNKGNRNDCNNYRGISLLSTVGKVFTRIALTRLQS